uniref:Ulp1 protease-like n=2 Tax=Oryza TaxID=4527 RepID=Q67W90_ORYSJ|nr:Ulp1 protease-like [Oryza sativa Japonica Group]BAD37579.1 Ulp1 protease-like [Oryza sativa Japonica Group]
MAGRRPDRTTARQIRRGFIHRSPASAAACRSDDPPMARILASCIGYVHLCLVFLLPSGVQNRSTCDILNRSLEENNKDLRTTILTIKYTTQSHNIKAYIRQNTPPDIDFRDRHGYSPTVSPDTVRRYESAISDLAGHGFEVEGYPVVDYESDLQTAMSTIVR